MSQLNFAKEAAQKRIGYATVVLTGGIEYSILASTPQRLADAFNHLTDGMVYFDPSRVNRVMISKIKQI
jgi:hypothetical protein